MTDRFYDPADFEPQRSIGFLAKRVSLVSRLSLESLFAGEQVTYAQWRTLAPIVAGQVSTAAELAQSLCQNAGATMRILDHLERCGLIARKRFSGDRRIFLLEPTELGRTLSYRCSRNVAEFWNDRLVDWDHQDIEHLIGFLTRLSHSGDSIS